MSRHAEVTKLLDRIRRQGFRVELAKSGHYKIRTKDGHLIETVSSTPSDRNFTCRVITRLKRFGFVA